MNMQSGHKPINNNYNLPLSGKKLNPRNIGGNLPMGKKSVSKELFQQGRPHTSNVASLSNPGANLPTSSKNGRGSLFQSLPLKVEGEMMSVSKIPSRAGSKNTHSGQRKPIETPNRNENSINRKTEKRSFTPNTSNGINNSGMSLMGGSFKINQALLFPGSKLKKLDVSPKTVKSMSNNNKSYYIPKTSRNNLNLSNVSNSNKNKLNETNNSFLNNTELNKSKVSSGSTAFSKSMGRTATPNLRVSRSKGKNRSPFDESKLRPNLKSISKSPNNNLTRLSKKIHLVSSIVKIGSSSSGGNKSTSKTKNAFDGNQVKFQEFKNNKNASPQVPSYIKKVNNPKIQNVCNTKFGAPNVRKVVTGNLLNNNNTNDLSTNSSIKSKIEMTNYSNNGTNNSIINNNYPGNFNNKKEKDNYQLNSGTRCEDINNSSNVVNTNNSNNTINSSNTISNTNTNIVLTRSNLQKENKAGERENKTEFIDITTSPLLRKKVEVPAQIEFNSIGMDADTLLNNQMLNKLSAGKSSLNYNNIPSNINNNLSSTTLQNKKTIKLIHEYSKVGFSGYGAKKVNQDNYFVFKNFVNNPNHIFMAVCDGHGVLGHEVSGYLRENLPISLNNHLKAKNRNILLHNINSIIEDTFLDINYKLQTSDSIDTTFSGSTCASLIFTPEKIITANVGDSRAVLGRCVNGEWISHDLTRDHKPSEKDESARIKKRGGRIQPFRDDDNEFIGPPRVWLKEDEIPGLAMSRSFGDRVAASVGVIAEPEIFEYKFQEDDKFMIVASDGVWEFIESPECVNIIKEYYIKNDIVGCCENLYRESSTRWLKEEEVIDDISMIIVFFE